MRYSLDPEPAAPGFKDLVTILDRTGSFDWEALDIELAAPTLDECLAWGVREIDGITQELGMLKGRLSSSYPAGTAAPAATRAEPPAQAGWIRATATALEPFADLQARAGRTAAGLGELVDHDTILRATQLYAGRIKDGAIDARLLSGAYGWFIVSTVLDGLRTEVKALPPREAETLLAPFAPLLVLVGQIMEERDALSKKSRGETEALSAEVKAAQAEREEAEAALRLRGAPAGIPREKLVEMARKSEDEGAAAAAPRRPRRTRR